jgi:spermidine/putrescine transport system ATP-binding protein
VNTVLALDALSKHYPAQRAVDGVSLCIQKGEFFSLVGPSGCGKTTTLRLVAGFETPTSGDILLDGQSVIGLPPHQRDVSTVFQSYALFPHLTVEKNVAFGLERRRPGVSGAEIVRRVKSVLELVQLTGKEKRLPQQLSGGEKQRVALARSLVLQPKVLLLDEPLSALDPKLRKQMRDELKKLQRSVAITFLFITHDEAEALSLSDRMAVMNRGLIEQLGTPRELYSQPATRFVAEFLGGVNWVGGTAIRPECMRISEAAPEGVRCFRATVTGATFLGNSVQISTRLDNGSTCVVEASAGVEGFRPGDTVHVWWNPRDEMPLKDDGGAGGVVNL